MSNNTKKFSFSVKKIPIKMFNFFVFDFSSRKLLLEQFFFGFKELAIFILIFFRCFWYFYNLWLRIFENWECSGEVGTWMKCVIDLRVFLAEKTKLVSMRWFVLFLNWCLGTIEVAKYNFKSWKSHRFWMWNNANLDKQNKTLVRFLHNVK